MPLLIVGAGGVGREVLDLCLDLGVPVDGFIDDARAGAVERGLPVHAPRDADAGCDYIIAIADPDVRRRLATRLDGAGLAAVSLLHRTSVLTAGSTYGDGLLLQANTFVSTSVHIGRHCQVHYNATVGHDATLGDYTTVYPGANISGNVVLDSGATVGSNAVILQGLRVGERAFVGAGAVVTRDVPAAATVVGNPARVLRAARHDRT